MHLLPRARPASVAGNPSASSPPRQASAARHALAPVAAAILALALTLPAHADTTALWYDQFPLSGEVKALAIDRTGAVALLAQLNNGGGGLVRSYSSSRAVRWEAKVGYTPVSIVADRDSNIIVSGYTRSSNRWRTWVIKYTSAGRMVWQKTIDATGPRSRGLLNQSLAVDSDGNVILTGLAGGEIHDPDKDTRQPVGPQVTYWGISVVKYSPDGDFQWANQYTRARQSQSDWIYGSATDALGNIVLAGSSASTANPSYGTRGSLVMKIDANGTEVWRQGMGTERTSATGVAITASGDIYICGETTGTVYGWPRWGYDQDIFAARLTPDGTVAWANQILAEQTYSRAAGIVAPKDPGYYSARMITVLSSNYSRSQGSWDSLHWFGRRGIAGRDSNITLSIDGDDRRRNTTAISKGGPKSLLFLAGTTPQVPNGDVTDGWVAAVRIDDDE